MTSGQRQPVRNDSPEFGGQRTQRLYISVSAAAAVTCAAILAVLMVQANKTRVELQNNGVIEFNFVQQMDHNLDQLNNAVVDEQIARAEGRSEVSALTASSDIVRRFDVLYSALYSVSDRWAGSLYGKPDTVAAREGLTQFVANYEQRILSGQVLSDAELQHLSDTSRGLAKQVFDLGVAMYLEKSGLRDELSARMDWLSRATWFFGASFFLAGLTLYVLLTRASRRAATLFRHAKSSQHQLETALDELTSGDTKRKSQNRFLAAATHDLRQPLQAMQYYLAALEPHLSTDIGQQILGKAGRSTDAAQNLLSALLNISKLDAGVLEPKPANVDLDALLTRLHDDHVAEAEDRGLKLSVDTLGFWVHTDAQFLERILANLLGNALAYTRAGTIRIEVSGADSDTVQVSVIDTGIGIPERELEAIFNEYYRLDTAQQHAPAPESDQNNEREGMGLGLSIVRRLTRLLGVPLEVSSTDGRGTRFTLKLPMVQPSETAIAESVASRVTKSDQFDGLVVMIIDDDVAVRDGTTLVLEQRGCKVLAASGQEEALRILIESMSIPDVILADYQLLNGTTGVEAIEIVRDEVNEDIPAVLITGDTSPDRVSDARASTLALLHKPVGSAALFSTIRSVLSGATPPGTDGFAPSSVLAEGAHRGIKRSSRTA